MTTVCGLEGLSTTPRSAVEGMHLMNVVAAQGNHFRAGRWAPPALASGRWLASIPGLDCQVSLWAFDSHVGPDVLENRHSLFAASVPVVNGQPVGFVDTGLSVDVVDLSTEGLTAPVKHSPVAVKYMEDKVEGAASLELQLDRSLSINDTCEVGQVSIHTTNYTRCLD